MRATGFLYETTDKTYLVTARHNVLPTEVGIQNPRTEEPLWEVQANFTADEIDIYLPDGSEWLHHRILLSEVPENGIITAENIDLLAVQLPEDIPSHSLRVFSREDLREPSEETGELVVYGYATDSLPAGTNEYSTAGFSENLQSPQELRLTNLVMPQDITGQLDGVVGVGIDENASDAAKYNGLSGSPVLGDGLVGIHSGTSEIPDIAKRQDPSLKNTCRVQYTGSKFLRQIPTGLRLES